MIIRYIGVFLLLFSAVSCSSEKVTLSPLYDSLSDSKPAFASMAPHEIKNKKSEVFYASELINHLSTIPKFTNDALNREVGVLKYNVKDFVYAVEAYNITGKDNAMNNIEKSYRKIQKLRTYLNQEENEVINRYLVRIKSNISNLEALAAKPEA